MEMKVVVRVAMFTNTHAQYHACVHVGLRKVHRRRYHQLAVCHLTVLRALKSL